VTNVTTKPELLHPTIASNSHLFDDWFDPIETGIRERVRGLIEEMIRGELIAVPRARLNGCDGRTTEWKSRVLPNYQRRMLAADALIAGAYLAGTNTRRVFCGEVGKSLIPRRRGTR
jgi:putative transposase